MNCTELNMDKGQVHKLLCAASGDAALLYLYIQSGNDPQSAPAELGFNETRYSCAVATLRQLGLWVETKVAPIVGQRPQYSEADVLRADRTLEFHQLRGEIERLLGRVLATEELKILLGFINYLGLPMDVISLLVHYCKERTRQRGSNRNPSLRSIEKEAYAWAEQGIDTMEEAVTFIRNQNARHSRMGKLMQLLQIRGRQLTAGEEKYAQKWLDMGFSDAMLTEAYERTCLNTGGLNWPYMNKILTRWHEEGLQTPDQIKHKDKKSIPKGASGQLGQEELEAIQKLLREG